MREVSVKTIEDDLALACGRIACVYRPDIINALKEGGRAETDEPSAAAMGMLLENAAIASRDNIPICQDTGMAVVYAHIGQEVHFTGGDINEAVQKGVSRGYKENYLRSSVVNDPLFARINTGDNTPAVIYYDIIPGDKVVIELCAKGFGSENTSAVKMVKPAEGVEGVKRFVLDTIAGAGPNACPPMIVGVGIGGTFDYCAYLAKRALLRKLDACHPDEKFSSLEKELMDKANELRIGPMGLGGRTTVLKVNIEYYPTHIAGLPVAVNICCHAARHERMEF